MHLHCERNAWFQGHALLVDILFLSLQLQKHTLQISYSNQMITFALIPPWSEPDTLYSPELKLRISCWKNPD